jgi:predicted dienelactone hydrolase
MKILFHFFIFSLLVAFASSAFPQQFNTVPRSDGNSTPLTAYEPKSDKSCPPLALISPGAGGSERGYGYIAEALRRDGWRAIVMGHRESGMPALRAQIRERGITGGLAQLITDQQAYRGRFMDIRAALQWSEQRCHAPYKVLIGHSMGAITVMLEAGAKNNLTLSGERRFDTYVALSPEGPGPIFSPDSWRPIDAPMLVITGTRDAGLVGDYHWRTEAFFGLAEGCRWLAVIDGATHMNFGGVGFAATTKSTTSSLITEYLDGIRTGSCPTLRPRPGTTLRLR